MFVGHFAVALGAKRAAPRIPLGLLVAAAIALDLIWPLLLLAGVETVRIDPGNTAFTPLAFDHYPWSHSLVMALVWGGLTAAIAFPRLRSAAAPRHVHRRRRTLRRSRLRIRLGVPRTRRHRPLGVPDSDRDDHRDLGDAALVAATAGRDGDCRGWRLDVAVPVVGRVDRAAQTRPARMNAQSLLRGPREG